DLPRAPSHFPQRRIESKVADLEHVRPLRVTASGERPQAREELGKRERLDEVIIGARIQAGDPVLDGIARREHQHRCPNPAREQPSAGLESVDSRQHHVEDDCVVVVGARHPQGVLAGLGDIRRQPFPRQPTMDQARHPQLVLDDKHPHGHILPAINERQMKGPLDARLYATIDRTLSSILDTIGDTPLVRLTRCAPANGAELWLKLEYRNPTGSLKDRMALAMIEGAESEGVLAPGDTVVEYTGGSTGPALALVCRAKGYRCLIVIADCFTEERFQLMRALGAELDVVKSVAGRPNVTPQDIHNMVERAGELAAQPGHYATDQFNSPYPIEHHRDHLGREIWEQA